MSSLTHDLNTGWFANYPDSGFTFFPAVSPGEYRNRHSNLDNPYILTTITFQCNSKQILHHKCRCSMR